MRQTKYLTSLLFGLVVLILASAPFAAAQDNLLTNPDLTQGSGQSPLGWSPQSWLMGQDDHYDSPFNWIPNEQPAQLEVSSPQPDDARWIQVLNLQPGWYHFTANVRTENVGGNVAGANLSILEGWFVSRSIVGTTDWQPVGLYLKVDRTANVTLACRLGLYSSLNTGNAFFTAIKAVKVDGPANDGDPRFELPAQP